MTTTTLIAATGDSIARLSSENGEAWRVDFSLEQSGAQCVTVDPLDPNRVYAGTFDSGLYRSLDRGQTWTPAGEGIPHPRVLSVAFAPARPANGKSAIYAGTEPSNLYRSEDDGNTWEELTALTQLPSAPTWSFPPRPYTSHVRWIAAHPVDPETVYAGIELGGVMATRDGGLTWEDRKPGSYHDCHALATHAAAPGRVYEAAGGGVAFSYDAGLTWRTLDEGLGDRRYVWGLAVDPAEPDLWYVSAAHGSGPAHRNNGEAGARIFRRTGASSWETVGDGLPDPLPYMPYALLAPAAAPSTVYAGFQNGAIWHSTDAGVTWEQLAIQLPRLLALAA